LGLRDEVGEYSIKLGISDDLLKLPG